MFKKIVSILVLMLAMISFSFSYTVEQFTNYDSTFSVLENNKILIEKQLSIRNIHDVGIIPGQVEFKISNSDEDNPLKILNYSVTNRYDQDIRSRLVSTNEFSSIILDIFQPILPGFEYQINLDYTIEYESSGIFFKRVEMPLKENTRLPILEGDILINVPEGNSITYISYTNEDTIIDGNSVSITLKEDTPDILVFEYSFIPIRIANMPGSLIFWTLVNIILLIILAFEVKKELKKHKGRR